MKNKVISIVVGLVIGCCLSTGIMAAELLANAKVASMDIIFLGQKLKLSPDAVITNGTNEGYRTYFAAREVLEAMGYFVYWDSFNEDVVFSRYQQEIEDLKLKEKLDVVYGDKVIKKVSKDFLDDNLTNTTWEYMSSDKKYYMRYKFLPNGKYEFTYKKYDDERYDQDKGTYTNSDGGILFKSQENYKYDKYGEAVTFADKSTSGKKVVRKEDNDSKPCILNFIRIQGLTTKFEKSTVKIIKAP